MLSKLNWNIIFVCYSLGYFWCLYFAQTTLLFLEFRGISKEVQKCLWDENDIFFHIYTNTQFIILYLRKVKKTTPNKYLNIFIQV